MQLIICEASLDYIVILYFLSFEIIGVKPIAQGSNPELLLFVFGDTIDALYRIVVLVFKGFDIL